MDGKQIIFIVVGVLIILTILGSIDIIGEKFQFFSNFSGPIAKYVFGFDSQDIGLGTGVNLTSYATIVIFLMMWLIIFVAFGDIFESFSTFNPAIAWIIAFALAVITGLTQMTSKLALGITTWFTWAGTFAVYLALLTAIVAFLAVNFGITSLTKWIIARKLMNQAIRGETSVKKAASGIKHAKEFEEELEK